MGRETGGALQGERFFVGVGELKRKVNKPLDVVEQGAYYVSIARGASELELEVAGLEDANEVVRV
jgi:hypothetical protein